MLNNTFYILTNLPSDMLRRMALRNFQSFSDIEFDLSGKAGSVKSHAFVYGENGSGKSNLINAVFLFMASAGKYVRMSNPSDQDASAPDDGWLGELARDMHMIGSSEPMCLDFDFSYDGTGASYSIDFSPDGRIIYERLECKVNSRRGVLFEADDKRIYMVRGLIRDKVFRDRIRSHSAQYWGSRSLLHILMDEMNRSNLQFLESNLNANLLRFLEELKKVDVYPTTQSIRESDALDIISGRIAASRESDLNKLEEIISEFFSRLYSDVKGTYYNREATSDGIRYELFFRKQISGTVRDIPARMESAGTKKMMAALTPILRAVDGRIEFVDEMDSGVHDLLITNVMEQTIPAIKGQLVSTTHNTCLMDSLSPDSVYVIGVDRKGFKKIRCVSSIERIRSTNSIRHKYYEGNFLGIPYIADLGLTDIASIWERKG